MDEQHNESRLREELRHAVDHVQVPSDMWSRIRRRHRREPRQRMFAVATSIALLAIVVAAAFPLVRDAAQQRDPTGGTGPHPAVTPAPTPLPPGMPEAPPESWDVRPLEKGDHVPTGPPAILTRGSMSGRDWTGTKDWTLVAYPMGDDVCFGFLLTPDLTPGQGWCTGAAGLDGFVPPPQHINASEGSGGMVLGLVDKDTVRVRLTYPSGRIAELTREEGLFQREGLPAGFYLDIIPEGEPATSVDLIDVRAFDEPAPTTTTPTPTPEPPESGNSPLGLEPATGPVVTLDSGEIEGMPWEFVAHRWAEGICFGFRNERGMAGGGVAVCDPGSPGIGVMGDGGEGQPAFVWGAFPRDTEVIRIQLIDGQAFEVPPLGQEEFGVSFFVRVLPTGTSMEGVRAVEVAQAEGIGDPVPTTTTPNG